MEKSMFKEQNNSLSPSPIRALYELEIPPGCPIVLNDINGLLKADITPQTMDTAINVLIGTTFKSEKAVYVVAETLMEPMTQEVEQLLVLSDPKTTAVVFPGNGAKSVFRETLRTYAVLSDYDQFFVPTSRLVESGRPVGVTVALPKDLEISLENGQYADVIIIDDVIATGKTLNALRIALTTPSSISPRLQAMAWFCRQPTDVTGYQTIRGLYRYWAREGYPALNSLSTWLRDDTKGFLVREQYKEKYIRYPYGFDKMIAHIKSLTTMGGNI